MSKTDRNPSSLAECHFGHLSNSYLMSGPGRAAAGGGAASAGPLQRVPPRLGLRQVGHHGLRLWATARCRAGHDGTPPSPWVWLATGERWRGGRDADWRHSLASFLEAWPAALLLADRLGRCRHRAPPLALGLHWR